MLHAVVPPARHCSELHGLSYETIATTIAGPTSAQAFHGQHNNGIPISFPHWRSCHLQTALWLQRSPSRCHARPFPGKTEFSEHLPESWVFLNANEACGQWQQCTCICMGDPAVLPRVDELEAAHISGWYHSPALIVFPSTLQP